MTVKLSERQASSPAMTVAVDNRTARDASMQRLREEVAELRALAMRLVARQNAPVVLDLIPLPDFAAVVDRKVRTLKNDLLSRDPMRRMRWPEFTKTKQGMYLTTSSSIRRWMEERGESTHIDRVTLKAVESMGRRRARG